MAFNTRSPAVKRLLKEAQELSNPTELYYAQPLEDNIFEWHFTIRGPFDTDFAGGIYHGRILLPAEYPMKPPSIILLTQNGRFKTNEKICLSISGHHPETWLPSWSIRTALLALIGFMPTMGEGAIGSLDYSSEERKVLAKKSTSYICPICKIENSTILPDITENSQQDSAEAKELASQIQFKNTPKVSEDPDKNEPKLSSTSDPESSGLTRRAHTTSESRATTLTPNISSNTESNRTNEFTPVPQFNRNQSITSSQQDQLFFSTILMTFFSIILLFLIIRRFYLTFVSELI